MALNKCEMRSNRIKIAFFPKTHKNRPAAGALPPQTPIDTDCWGLRPQNPVCDTFEYTSLLNMSPNLNICTF